MSQNKDIPGYRSSGKIRVASRRGTEEEEEEHEFIRLHISKYTMVVIVVTEQCNTGDPLETSGGLYRGPPSMLIYINTIKCYACETLYLQYQLRPLVVKTID